MYAIEAWGSACKTELDKILIWQKRAMKYQVPKLIFKCINKITPVNFHNWFRINHERHSYYSTRSNVMLMMALK